MQENRYQPGLHRIAVLTACATFPLIFMGGLVTSHQAGMSVPDWPNSYGYNMFLFPPSLWVGGIFYEHTHRLMGTVVGMLSILQTLWAWRFETRRWVRWLSVGVLVAVVFQGVLGGLRVVMVELDLAIVHACFAQAFFCLTALMIAVTSRWWREARPADPVSRERAVSGPKPVCARRAFKLAAIAVAAIYLQLIAGAVMRHYQAGLAIPDLPLAYGKLLPPTDAAELAAVNQWRVWHGDGTLDRVTLAQIWVHFAHRVGAVLVTVAVLALVARVVRRHRAEKLLLRPAVLLTVLLVAQITLGVLTVLDRKPADVASLHVAVGALTLFTAFVVGLRAARLAAAANAAVPYKISRKAESADVPADVVPDAVTA